MKASETQMMMRYRKAALPYYTQDAKYLFRCWAEFKEYAKQCTADFVAYAISNSFKLYGRINPLALMVAELNGWFVLYELDGKTPYSVATVEQEYLIA